MSSSNRVRVVYIKETSYGVTPTPLAGGTKWHELRKTSESLSGTPTTTESAEARTDRQSAGQITTGLEVKGAVEFEVAGSECFKDMLLAGMKYDNSNADNGWLGAAGEWAPVIEDTATANLVIDFVPKSGVDPAYVKLSGGTFTNIAAAFAAAGRNRVKGHIIQLINTGVTTPTKLSNKNKKCIYIPRTPHLVGADTVGTVTGTSIIGYAKDMVDEGGKSAILSVPLMSSVGTLDISYTLEKRFMDLTNKSIIYRGGLVDTMSLNFAYGEIAKGTFNYVANDHVTPLAPEAPADTVANLLTAPETQIALNASVDVGLVIVDDAPTSYCIQSLAIELNNNSQAQNCIGSIAPEKYTQGSAAIKVDMTAYLEDSNWDYIEKKIKSTPIQILYYALNQDGGLAVNVPEVQLSFDDPNATGKDAIVELAISGSAKVTSIVELKNSMFLYWLKPTG